MQEIVGPNDPPEVKLQKIYARVQQLRNTSYEVRENRRGGEAREGKSAGKCGGSLEARLRQRRRSHLALSWPWCGRQDLKPTGSGRRPRNYFFNPNLMQSGRLDSNLVLVKLNGKNIFCDPGAAFTPFGLLPWTETGVQGLQLDKKESTWIDSACPRLPPRHAPSARPI